MTRLEEKHKVIIDKFQTLLRSGMDYDVKSMYREAGKIAFLDDDTVKKIVNKHYRGILSLEMIRFERESRCKHSEKVKLFSKEFDLCQRESELLIRYAKTSKIKT